MKYRRALLTRRVALAVLALACVGGSAAAQQRAADSRTAATATPQQVQTQPARQVPATDAARDARASALFESALGLQQAGRFEAARDEYLRVLELKPDSAPTLNNLGKVYSALGQVEPALEHYRRAAEIAGPNQPFYREQYADLLWHSERQSDAVREYRALATAEPAATRARGTVAAFYMKGGDKGFGELVAYLWELVGAGDVLTAADVVFTALDSSGLGSNQRVELLTVLARVLAQETLSARQSGGVAKRLMPLRADPVIGQGVSELLAVQESPDGSFSWWASRGNPWEEPARGMWPRDAFRQLIRALGSAAEWREDTQLAEVYYLKSAELNPDELDPLALQKLCALYMRKGEFERVQAIVKSYVPRLFGGKSEAYRRNQLAKIYQYHVTLGYIYGSLASQGIIEWGDSRTPTSAVFQLENARRIGAKLDAQKDPTGSQAAHVDVGVVALLGMYYEKTEPAKATELRTDASRRLMQAGSTNAAQQVLRPLPPTSVRAHDAVLKPPVIRNPG